MTKRPLIKAAAIVAMAAIAAPLAGCAESKREDKKENSGSSAGGSDSKGDSKGGGTFVFGAASDPVMLDPAFASDGETFRISRQLFEGLVSTKPGSAETAPGLATKWTASEDGLTYTFDLREGVKFHDGTDFNAEAVCANFERWYNWTGINQSENISYYYSSLFKGFKKNESDSLGKSIYGGCKAEGTNKAVITLTKPFAGFAAALSLPAFAMQSPTALKKYDADNTSGTAADTRFSEYATKHPTGTGPFVFDSWEKGQKVTLKRNDNYWGDKAKVSKVILQTLSEGNARLQALKAGEIDGFDMVAPGDLEKLKSDGFTVTPRPPFTILYLGMNQANKDLKNLKVRQAIAHAIDKKAVASQSLPAETKLATQFMPDTVTGYNTGVTKYDYNPEKAKELLKEAGVTDLTLKFNYPTGVSRPYMPNPQETFVAIKSQLEAVGIKVEPVADKWSPDYLDKIKKEPEAHDLHLLGWTGDYNDSDNFVGVFFGKKSGEWGFDNPELFKALDEARGLKTAAEQKPKYEAINKQIMDFLPGVPIAHPVPSLAFNKKVSGYDASPVGNEVWNTVSVSK